MGTKTNIRPTKLVWTNARVIPYAFRPSGFKFMADGRTQTSLCALSGNTIFFFFKYCTDLFAGDREYFTNIEVGSGAQGSKVIVALVIRLRIRLPDFNFRKRFP
jgi:hypothetical protein